MAIRSFQSCKQMFVKAVRSASAGPLNIFWQWDTRRWTRTLRNLWWRASPSIRCCRCCWLRTEIALLRPARFSFHFAFSSQCLWRLINESIQASSVRSPSCFPSSVGRSRNRSCSRPSSVPGLYPAMLTLYYPFSRPCDYLAAALSCRSTAARGMSFSRSWIFTLKAPNSDASRPDTSTIHRADRALTCELIAKGTNNFNLKESVFNILYLMF